MLTSLRFDSKFTLFTKSVQQKLNANFSSELTKVEKPLESFSPHPSMPNFGLINRSNSQPNSQACSDNENNKKLAAVEGSSEYTPVDVILTKHLQNYQGRKNILKPSSDRPLDRMKSNIFLQGQGSNFQKKRMIFYFLLGLW